MGPQSGENNTGQPPQEPVGKPPAPKDQFTAQFGSPEPQRSAPEAILDSLSSPSSQNEPLAPSIPPTAAPMPDSSMRTTAGSEVGKLQEALKSADERIVEANSQYLKALLGDNNYKLADRARVDAYNVYKEALDKSGLAKAAFNETLGKELWEKLTASWDARRNAELVFGSTSTGIEIWKKINEAWRIHDGTENALKQAKTSPS